MYAHSLFRSSGHTKKKEQINRVEMYSKVDFPFKYDQVFSTSVNRCHESCVLRSVKHLVLPWVEFM